MLVRSIALPIFPFSMYFWICWRFLILSSSSDTFWPVAFAKTLAVSEYPWWTLKLFQKNLIIFVYDILYYNLALISSFSYQVTTNNFVQCDLPFPMFARRNKVFNRRVDLRSALCNFPLNIKQKRRLKAEI